MSVAKVIAGAILLGISNSGSKNEITAITSVRQLLDLKYDSRMIKEINLEVDPDDWWDVYQAVKQIPFPYLERLSLRTDGYAWHDVNTAFEGPFSFPNLEHLSLTGVTMGSIGFITRFPELKSLMIVGGEMEYNNQYGDWDKSCYIDGSSADLDDLMHLESLILIGVKLDHIGVDTIRRVSELVLLDCSVENRVMYLNFEDIKNKRSLHIEKTKEHYGSGVHNIALKVDTPGQYLQLKGSIPNFIVGNGLVAVYSHDETNIRRY